MEAKLQSHELKFEKVNDIQIIQPAVVQNHEGCAFAAVAKLLDYQLRILYAKAFPPTSLSQKHDCLFDYKKWEAELRDMYAYTASRWHPEDLLSEAKSVGVPLRNSGYHMIQHSLSAYIAKKSKIEQKAIIKEFLDFSPCVGVMRIKNDYKANGGKIYLWFGDNKTEVYVNKVGKRVEKVAYHAIVCLDYVEIDYVMFVCYQNQSPKPDESLCGRAISWMLFDNIVELHYGASLPPVHPPAVLQSKTQMSNVRLELKNTREAIDVVNNYQLPCEALLERGKSLLGKSEWKEAEDILLEIKGIIEKNSKSCNILKKFIKKYGGVVRASELVSKPFEEVLKASQCSLQLHDTLIKFCSDNEEVVAENISGGS